MNPQLKELHTMLSNHFSCQVLKSIVAQPLSNKGQYFTSCIHNVKIILEEDQTESHVDFIVKVLPPGEHEIEYNSKLKFKKEIEFYNIALPQYHSIQERNKLPKLNIFPHFYFASEEFIVLEDLHSDGYIVQDSLLDKEQCKLVLQELAKFHATGIALKLSNQNIFEEKLASVCVPALQNDSNPDKDKINLQLRLDIRNKLSSNDDLRIFTEAVDTLLCEIDKKKLPTPVEPFSTLLHNDLWRGNIMFKNLSSDGVSVKFIDFQTVIMNSPARDLVYFLFSSVESGVLSEFPDLIKCYHLSLVQYLSHLGVDVSEFSFDKLMFEVNRYGPSKLKHLLLLFKTLCSVKDGESTFEQYLYRTLFLFKDRCWL